LLLSKPTLEILVRLRSIADYQFGKGVGKVLIPDNVLVARSPNTLRIRHVVLEGKGTIATLRASDYLYSLHIIGGMLLKSGYKPPRFRVVIKNDIVDYVRDGGSVFTKHVVDYDPKLRAGSEVIIVDEDDNLIGVGKLRVSPVEIEYLGRGEAVKIRHTIGD